MPWGKLKTADEFETVLRTIKEIGFEGAGIEFSLLPVQLKHEPEMLASMMGRVGLESGGSYSRTRASDIDWARRSKTPLFWVTVKERTYPAALSRLREFTRKANKQNIASSLHNELRSSFETQDQILGALKAIQGLTLCIDTAHGVGAGVDSVGLIERYPNRISLIHLKDLRQILPKYKIRFKRDFVNVGDGVLDLKSVVRKLQDVGYEGQLMLEIEALAGQKPTDVVATGYEHISKML
jgi:sugar phosphate isomerase/epimerase